MGADTTSTHLIFFIAATVVATATAGILSGVVTNVVGKASIRGQAFGDELASSIKVINDPGQVVTNPSTIFYVKNTGSTNLDYFNATVILDGAVVTTSESLLNGDRTFGPGSVAQITYASVLSSGDHRVQVVMNNNAMDEFRFRI